MNLFLFRQLHTARAKRSAHDIFNKNEKQRRNDDNNNLILFVTSTECTTALRERENRKNVLRRWLEAYGDVAIEINETQTRCERNENAKKS